MTEENSPQDHQNATLTTATNRTNNATIDSDTCFLCYGRGHWARCCTSLPPIYLVENPPRCFTCGGIGHYARFCPSRLGIYNRFLSYTLTSSAAAAAAAASVSNTPTSSSSSPYYEDWIRPRAISEPIAGSWAICNLGACDPLYNNFVIPSNAFTENHPATFVAEKPSKNTTSENHLPATTTENHSATIATENNVEAHSSTTAFPIIAQHAEATLPPHPTSKVAYQQARDDF